MRAKHGMSGSPEFGIWTDMQTRCYNPNFKDFKYYGGRGITVCELWLNSFEAFYGDLGPRPSLRHSIDRKDSDGHYAPDNCRWATAEEQANNKSNTVRITLNGITKPLAEWCKERGVKRPAAWLRYKDGIRGEAIFSPRCQQITHNGVIDTVSGWSKRTGLKATTITMRITKYGWPIEQALTKGATL